MLAVQGNVLQSLRAVQNFLDANAAVLGSVVTSGARQRLDDCVKALEDHADMQTGSNLSAQGATQRQYALRTALLRDHMAVIAKIAAAEIPDSPDVEPLKLPQGRLTAERLKAAAMGMMKAATPYKAVFIANGMPEDFLDQLAAAADAVVNSVGARKASRVVRGGATSGLKSLASRGRKIVHVLDAMVKSALRNDKDTLAAWNIAKRVERYPQPKAATPATGGAPSTPAPSTGAGSSPAPAAAA